MDQLGPNQLSKLQDLGKKTDEIKEENEEADEDDEVPELVDEVDINAEEKK